MKKILFSLLALVFGLALIGCVNTGGGDITNRVVALPDELPTDEVTIIFWHIYGQGKTELLDEIIAEFEEMYPNVTIDSTSQTDYTTLRDKINAGIPIEEVPTMAIGYPDHFAGYITTGAVVSLDQLINSTKTYEVTDSTSSIFGETVSVGVDLSDFVTSYLDENNQYEGGYYYSLPYSKSTETMAVNRYVLKSHVSEIRAAGITISDEGFLSHTEALTYAQLALLKNILVDTNGTNVTTKQCEYLLNYDSSANLFINMSRQWGAGYTNSEGQILIDNTTTRSMLSYLDSLFLNNTVVLPIEWDQNFGSNNFIYGDVCMSVGSTAGVKYNLPSAITAAADKLNMQFGANFTDQYVDFLPVPQYVSTTGDSFTVGDNSYTGSLSAVQQGPNIGIFSEATDEQILYAWLFIQFLTNAENAASWAMDTGYLPVRLSAYQSTEYSAFLQIAQDFWAADGNPSWETTDARWNKLASSMVANIAQAQVEYYQYDPAFAAGTNSASSATSRDEAGYCLENIYTDKYDPEAALTVMKNQLTW